MRVLFWSSTFWPHIGGAEVLGANLAAALQRRGHDLLVLTRRDSDDLPAASTVDGVPVRRLPFQQAVVSQDAGLVLDVRRQVVALLAELQPEVVHLYNFGPDLLFHRLAGTKAPQVLTLHGPVTDPVASALPAAGAVAACSEAVLSDTVARFPEVADRVHLVRNALPPAVLDAEVVPPGPPVVLFVGRVVPQKGFDLGLRAFARFREVCADARLVVVGDGISAGPLAGQAAELGLAEAVELVGWCDPVGVREHMGRATMVVMPSRFEPFGLVALEAGQSRRPVVAFAVDGLVEAVVHGVNGLLVPPGDVDGLAEAMVRVATEPGLAARLGDAGHDPAKAAADWDAHVTAHEDLYAGVLR
ncbi:MAG TPA: glycosyltransferase family 4 protein [Acidimicrobiales bacterium]|nr:glycosyltransferase family 4 protein [Acidimicrobiales bacterium]